MESKMKMSKFALTLLFSSLFFTANSQAQQPVYAKDQRIQYFTYNSDNVYPIYSKLGYSTLIQLEDDEHLQDDEGILGMGFAKGWSLGVKGNNIVFKPIADLPDTNLLVVTNKRTYAFDLKVRDSNITYVAKFKYPDTEQKNKEKIADKLPSQLYIRPVKDEKNKDIMELYKSKHLSSYNRYGDLDGQVVFKITPKKVSYWKYSSADGEPYREIFYVDRKMAERIEF